MASTEEGTTYVFAGNADGALRVAALTGPERGKWTELGGQFAGSVAVLPGRREIEIFGVTPAGQPQHGTWRIGSSRKPEWSIAGRGLGRDKLRHLDVLVTRPEVHLLALTEDRRLLTLTRGKASAWGAAWKDHGSLDAFGFERPAPQKGTRPKAMPRQANGAVRPAARPRNGMPMQQAAE